MRRLVIAGIGAAIVATAVWVWLQWLPSLPAVPAGVVPALAAATVPVSADDPESSEEDVLFLLPLLSHRRVVALGEATHGTREFFRLKDRVFRLLVTHASFTTFALEISPEAGKIVNRYVSTGAGDARTALRQFEFWTWKTEEVLALIEWMRRWNLAHPDRPVSFIGINATGPDRDRRMAVNVQEALDQGGPDTRIVIWAHNAHVATAAGWMGAYLRAALAQELYVIGFEFLSGSFRSRSFSGIRYYDLPSASDDYYAADLGRLQSPIVFLDIRRAKLVPLLAQWLDSPRRSHDIDELFYVTRVAERWHSSLEPWAALYDGVMFVRQTTAARGLFDGDRPR